MTTTPTMRRPPPPRGSATRLTLRLPVPYLVCSARNGTGSRWWRPSALEHGEDAEVVRQPDAVDRLVADDVALHRTSGTGATVKPAEDIIDPPIGLAVKGG